MLTPMFGGPPPPSCSRQKQNGKKIDSIANYIISVAVPWNYDERPAFELSASGMTRLCAQWDNSSASFVNRQRYRQVHHFIQKRIRQSDHEITCLDWRARNATRWKEKLPDAISNTTRKSRSPDDTGDVEANGILSGGDDYLYWLTRAAALGNPIHRDSIQALQSTFLALMRVEDAHSVGNTYPAVSASHLQTNVYQHNSHDKCVRPELSLQLIAKRIRNMPSCNQGSSSQNFEAAPTHTGRGGVHDPLTSNPVNPVAHDTVASPEQQAIIDWILHHLDKATPVQTLTLMHGGAGTGKSFVIHKLRNELLKRGLKTIITCPTGAAACQFPGGQTCHAAFKIGRDGDHISPAKLAELRVVFDDSVGLIVTDEVSMLGSEFSVKMDKRLRLVYNPDVPFGGKSILWVRFVMSFISNLRSISLTAFTLCIGRRFLTVGGAHGYAAMQDNVQDERECHSHPGQRHFQTLPNFLAHFSTKGSQLPCAAKTFEHLSEAPIFISRFIESRRVSAFGR